MLIRALNSANIHFIAVQCQVWGFLEAWHKESERKAADQDSGLENDKSKAENDLALITRAFCWKNETKKYLVSFSPCRSQAGLTDYFIFHLLTR